MTSSFIKESMRLKPFFYGVELVTISEIRRLDGINYHIYSKPQMIPSLLC